jgi:4-hydroxy-2-oxoheptanedioate aldolase
VTSTPVSGNTEGAARSAQTGTFVAIADPTLAEILASAYDVLVIDLEHGSIDVSQAQTLMMAIQSRGAKAYVRLANSVDSRLAAVLDAGADGVMAPMIESSAQAGEFVQRTDYPPAGSRGFGPRRAGDFGRQSTLEGPAPVRALQIETPAGVDHAEEVAAAAGVDLIVLGCSDLAVAYGKPGRFDSEEIHKAIRVVFAAAHEAGVRFGLAVGGPLERAPVNLVAADLLLHAVDLRLYVSAIDEAATGLRALATQDLSA